METILNTFKKVRHYAFGHKSWAIALVGVAALGGYFGAQTFDGGLAASDKPKEGCLTCGDITYCDTPKPTECPST